MGVSAELKSASFMEEWFNATVEVTKPLGTRDLRVSNRLGLGRE